MRQAQDGHWILDEDEVIYGDYMDIVDKKTKKKERFRTMSQTDLMEEFCEK